MGIQGGVLLGRAHPASALPQLSTLFYPTGEPNDGCCRDCLRTASDRVRCVGHFGKVVGPWRTFWMTLALGLVVVIGHAAWRDNWHSTALDDAAPTRTAADIESACDWITTTRGLYAPPEMRRFR